MLDVIEQEEKDPDKIILPRFMPKLYPLENKDSMLPDNVHVDSVVASLLDCGSMAEENDP